MNKYFNLTISSEIFELAKRVLSEEDIVAANKLSEYFVQNEHMRLHAIEELREYIGVRPKRPVYYLNFEICRLPEETRDVVRYAGDFIDQLIKHCAHERGKYIFRFNAYRSSLGLNLKKLKGILPDSLIGILKEFNDLIYVKAKHSWEVGDRPHLFSCKEAVFACFVIKKIAIQVEPFSIEGRWYLENKMYNYHAEK